MMNECKIVQDLLPLYAEELVSAETRIFVEEHCAGCETCAAQRARMCVDLDREENCVDYQKNMRRSVLEIVGKTLLACILVVIVVAYGLWEWGFLDKQVYTAPDGNYRFQVVNCDAGFFPGGACITTPEGRDINLYNSESYQDFQVWYEPDSRGYFACISYDDHQETWLCLSEQDEESEMKTTHYYPSGEITERDFYSILRASEKGQEYLTEEAVITFDRWSVAGQFRGRYLYFNYEVPGSWSGEIIYDVVEQEVKEITCVYTRRFYMFEVVE